MHFWSPVLCTVKCHHYSADVITSRSFQHQYISEWRKLHVFTNNHIIMEYTFDLTYCYSTSLSICTAYCENSSGEYFYGPSHCDCHIPFICCLPYLPMIFIPVNFAIHNSDILLNKFISRTSKYASNSRINPSLLVWTKYPRAVRYCPGRLNCIADDSLRLKLICLKSLLFYRSATVIRQNGLAWIKTCRKDLPYHHMLCTVHR